MITSSVSVHPKLMAASAQVALVIAVLKYKYLEVVECMTDSARDKDEVTKDKKMTICLKLEADRVYNKMAAKVVQLVSYFAT